MVKRREIDFRVVIMNLLQNITDWKDRTTLISFIVKSTREIRIVFHSSSARIVKKKEFTLGGPSSNIIYEHFYVVLWKNDNCFYENGEIFQIIDVDFIVPIKWKKRNHEHTMCITRMTIKAYVELESSCGHQPFISQTVFGIFFLSGTQFPVRKPVKEYTLCL